MRFYIIFILIIFSSYSSLYAQVIKKRSLFSHDETVKKVEALIASKNLQILSKIDHSKSAAVNKIYLPPSTLIIFGNAQLGSGIMADNPVWGVHLPLKVAVYDDKKGKTWVVVPDLKDIAGHDRLKSQSMDKVKIMAHFLVMMLHVK